MREDYVFADREVVGSYGLRAQSEREPPYRDHPDWALRLT